MRLGEESPGLVMARWVVERGGDVLPCYINKELDKYPLVRGGVNAASRDMGQVMGWWGDEGRYSWAGVGVAGKAGGWCCFDADGPEARDWLLDLVGPEITGGLAYKTPGRNGGMHLWFRWPSWLEGVRSLKVIGSSGEVQFRGIGCWSLLPCKRADGEYEVLNAPECLDEMPRELWEKFLAVAEQFSGLDSGTGPGDLKELSPGRAWELAPWTDNRKNAVAGLAWYLSLRLGTVEEVLEQCTAWAEGACVPALDISVVERKVYYAWNRLEGVRRERAKETEREMRSVELWRSRR